MSALRVIEPRYAHACDAWNGWLIDETDPAFHRCRCFQPTPDLLAIQDAHAIALDYQRGAGGLH